jgi:hypothetical protein
VPFLGGGSVTLLRYAAWLERGSAAPGRNTLKIEVANLWANRIAGDFEHPEAGQFTKSNVKGRLPTLPSGLLSPVHIDSAPGNSP